jgi:ssDNA thymidine ADP-ribosyltransferase, DarT
MTAVVPPAQPPPPNPTPILRLIHVDNLSTILQRGALHATNFTPKDGLPYRTIHNPSIQAQRQVRRVPCGPQGVVHDYVPFYFGYLSPMLLQLKTGRVPGYSDGQGPLIYPVSTVQAIAQVTSSFAFSNGHGIAAYTSWFDDLQRLDQVDWAMVYQRYWTDTLADLDRQRRKQAELLVHHSVPWGLIQEIAVLDAQMQAHVEKVLATLPAAFHRPVQVRQNWYYY